LQALARVLVLDSTATQYLLGLSADRVNRPGRPRPEVASVGVRQLLESLDLPAFVETRMFDVLAANRLAAAFSPSIRPGQNRLRSTFLDEAERALHPDWDRAASAIVASFRTSIGTDVEDPRIAQLVGELSLLSERFGQLWARHDVRPLAGGVGTFRHPDVGLLQLRREKLAIGDSNGQLLVIFHAEPGSASARSLALLRSAANQDASSS
jgi:hypothetical protein